MPLKPENPRRGRGGFTLVELMVAIACASILSAAAWNLFGLFQRGRTAVLQSYQRESGELIQKLQNACPYNKKTGKRRSPMNLCR